MTEMKESRRRSLITLLLVVIAVILTGWALKATKTVTMPLAFAFFSAALVYPVQRWLRHRLPRRVRWLSYGAPMLLIVALYAAAAAGVWLAVEQAANSLSASGETLDQIWKQAQSWIQSQGIPLPENASQDVTSRVSQLAAYALSAFGNLLGFLTLVFFLVFLMLLEAHQWQDKVGTAFCNARRVSAVKVVDAVAVKLRAYLWVRTLVSLIAAVVNGLWLLAMGLDYAYLWAALFFVMNYIPNVGSIVAGVPPALYALFQLGSTRATVLILGLLVLEQITGNFVDPKLQGRQLSLSPLVVLLALIFWGWVWGVAGALLAVPLTIALVIVCMHVPELRPLAILLSEEGDEEKLREESEAE